MSTAQRAVHSYRHQQVNLTRRAPVLQSARTELCTHSILLRKQQQPLQNSWRYLWLITEQDSAPMENSLQHSPSLATLSTLSQSGRSHNKKVRATARWHCTCIKRVARWRYIRAICHICPRGAVTCTMKQRYKPYRPRSGFLFLRAFCNLGWGVTA